MRSGLAASWAALAILLACAETSAAETPAAPSPAPSGPPTLWSFLGLKQCVDKCKKQIVLHNEKKAENQAVQGGHSCLKRLFGPLCPCGCLKCEILKRKPPVKPLADPANLQSQNPAIKAAAEIKTEEDLAPQKIKAIRYLATIACGCYPQVKPALLAALDDCTEEVRFEAAFAFCRSAGNPCTVCNSSTCCDPDVRKKLSDLASGRDDHDCWKEPSARVRSAAAGALNACEAVAPPETAVPPKEKPKELPVPETPPGENALETADAKSVSPAPRTITVSSMRVLDATADDLSTPASEQPDGGPADEGTARSTESRKRGSKGGPAIIGGPPNRRGSSSCIPCPCQDPRQKPESGLPLEETEPGQRRPEEPTPQEAAPSEETTAPSPTAPSPADLAGTFGAAAGPQSAAPNMIGDFFGGAASQATVVRSFVFNDLEREAIDDTSAFFTVVRDQDGTRVAVHYPDTLGLPEFPITDVNDASGRLGGAPLAAVPAGGTFREGKTTDQDKPGEEGGLYTSQFQVAYVLSVPSPGTGGGVGRMKIAENTSPMPRDRWIFDYGYFTNVPLAPGGVNVNRFTLGFEKTFVDGDMSFELKAPFASTVDSTVVQGAAANTGSGAFGNLALAVKTLLSQTQTWAFSGGLQIALPTADDTRVVQADGTPLLVIRNDAVHLGPFLGALWTPNSRLFSQGFLQFDIASVGNTVQVNRDDQGLSDVGSLNDATLLILDWGIGYWVLRDSRPYRALTGLAWTAELHWTRSLQDPDTVSVGSSADTAEASVVALDDTKLDVLDLTLGCHFAWRQKTIVTCGYAVPLYAGAERPFDGEFRVMINHHFGSSSRLTQPF